MTSKKKLRKKIARLERELAALHPRAGSNLASFQKTITIGDMPIPVLDPEKIHNGWLLTPRSEEKRSMEGGTE